MRLGNCLALACITLSLLVLPSTAAAETEPNNTTAQANTIAIGFDKGEINATLTSNDLDFYKFTTVANMTYVFETFNIQGSPGNRATGIRLFNASGTEIADDRYGNNGTGNVNARLVYTFVNAGTYYIRVSRAEFTTWTGSYSLRALPKYNQPNAGWDAQTGEPNDTPEIANAIDVGLSGSLTRDLFDHTSFVTANSDYDFYRFDAVAGRTYIIETYNVQGTPRSRATGITLFNAVGTAIMDDEYGNAGTGATNTRMIFTATSSDTYLIQVRRAEFVTWTGTYSIRVLAKYDEPSAGWDAQDDAEPNDAIPIANALEVGPNNAVTHQLAPYTSVVNANSDHDFYRFNAEAGKTYVIQTFNVQEDTSGDGTGLYLYNSTGSELANDKYGSDTGNVDAEIRFTFATSGTYFVLVKDEEFSDWSGPYSLRVCDGSCTQDVFLPVVRK